MAVEPCWTVAFTSDIAISSWMIEDPPPLETMVSESRPCIRCSYELQGLSMSGNCPECGASVASSFHGMYLRYASPDYISTLQTGFTLALHAILLQVVAVIIAFLGAFWLSSAMGLANSNAYMGRLVSVLLGVPISVMSLMGYWRLTQPDPGFAGREKSDSSRRVIRTAVGVQALLSTVGLLAGLVSMSSSSGTSVDSVSVPIAMLSNLVFAVQFFAMMNYLIWLAKRIPDEVAIDRAKRNRWLLPILCTFGCLMIIGPLIAMVMYWNLLDRVRKYLRTISKGHAT